MDPQNPRTKQQIKDLLYQYLYAAVERRMAAKLAQLIQQNCLVQHLDYQGFSYKGTAHVLDTRPQPRKLPRLVPQLHPAMEAYLAELNQINRTEIPFVLGFLNQVLNSSNDLQDYLRVLPDCLHPPIQKLIDECSCRTTQLDEPAVVQLQAKNQVPIEMIRQRLLLNLIE